MRPNLKTDLSRISCATTVMMGNPQMKDGLSERERGKKIEEHGRNTHTQSRVHNFRGHHTLSFISWHFALTNTCLSLKLIIT